MLIPTYDLFAIYCKDFARKGQMFQIAFESLTVRSASGNHIHIVLLPNNNLYFKKIKLYKHSLQSHYASWSWGFWSEVLKMEYFFRRNAFIWNTWEVRGTLNKPLLLFTMWKRILFAMSRYALNFPGASQLDELLLNCKLLFGSGILTL